MSQFASRNTPILSPDGFQEAALPGTTELVTDLVNVPPEANAARIQGLGRASIGYRQDATVGAGAAQALTANEVYLSNRQQISQCVVVANGGAASFTIQFYTGRTGQ